MNPAPLVSVIIPAYNAAAYINAALDSILNQSYQNLEVLVYDDCSTDDTVGILRRYQDPRIRLIEKNSNTGYTDSLNAGLTAATGKYIARMDSDDISDISRIEKQVAFLETHPEYGIVGSWLRTIRNDQPGEVWHFPADDPAIRRYLLANSPFAHPSVLIRRDVLQTNGIRYDRAYEPCEDYQLWTQLLKVTKGANLQEPLLLYRMHSHQTTQLRKQQLIDRSNKVRKEVVRDFFHQELDEKHILTHYYFFNEIPSPHAPTVLTLHAWKKHLTTWLQSGNKRNEEDFLGSYWIAHLRTLTRYRPGYAKFLGDRYILANFSIAETARFLIKCLISYKIKTPL